QAIGDERDENVGLNAVEFLVVYGTQQQVPLQVLEGFLHVRQLQIKLPELGWLVWRQAAAEQVAAFAPPRLSQFFPAQFIRPSWRRFRSARLLRLATFLGLGSLHFEK